MIRGACILAVGFALGYAKALSELPEVRESIHAMKKAWQEEEARTDRAKDKPDDDTHPEGETAGD